MVVDRKGLLVPQNKLLGNEPEFPCKSQAPLLIPVYLIWASNHTELPPQKNEENLPPSIKQR